MKKLILLFSLSLFPAPMLGGQDQETPCNPCERYQYYKLRAEKASTVEQFDEMWAKSLPYKKECEQNVEQIDEREIRALERVKIGLYLTSFLLVVSILQDAIKK